MAYSSEIHLQLPLARRSSGNEVAFNSALGWLLQASPDIVSGMTQILGTRVDIQREYNISVRGERSAKERPDLLITGWTWDPARLDWRKLAIAIELKISANTPLTESQKSGYSKSLADYDTSKFILVAPSDYKFKHAAPSDSLILSLDSLFNVLKKSAKDTTACALVSEIWTSYLQTSIKVEELREAIEDPTDYSLYGLLRDIQRFVGRIDGIRPGRLGSSRTRGNPYIGFHIYPDKIRKSDYCAWIGFIYIEDDEEPYLQVDFAEAKMAQSVKRLLPKGLGGEVHLWDYGSSPASWRATHVTRGPSVISTQSLKDSGLNRVLKVVSKFVVQ